MTPTDEVALFICFPLAIILVLAYGPNLTGYAARLLAFRDSISFFKERVSVWNLHLEEKKDERNSILREN